MLKKPYIEAWPLVWGGLNWFLAGHVLVSNSLLLKTSLGPTHDQLKPSHDQLRTSLYQLKPAAMLQNIPNQHMLFFSTGL